MSALRSAVVLGCAMLATVGPAAACAGGGHGGGSRGGGGRGGTVVRGGAVCDDVSDVVGRIQCRRFGDWDATNTLPIFFEVGTSARALDLSSWAGTGTASHDNRNHSFSLRAGTLAPRTPLLGVVARAGWMLGRWAYVGAQLDVAGTALDGPATATNGLVETPRAVAGVGVGGFAGVMFQHGAFTARAEVMAAVDVDVLTFASALGPCNGTATSTFLHGRIEPRAALEARVSPWTSVGVMGGTNALDTADWSASVYVRWSLRSYDGTAR